MAYTRNEQGEVMKICAADNLTLGAAGQNVTANWSGVQFTMQGIAGLSVDAGAGADTVFVGDLSGTTLKTLDVSLGSTRSIVDETRPALDANGQPLGTDDTFRIAHKTNDAAQDILTITGKATAETLTFRFRVGYRPGKWGIAEDYLKLAQVRRSDIY